jgi:hypothetical protein
VNPNFPLQPGVGFVGGIGICREREEQSPGFASGAWKFVEMDGRVLVAAIAAFQQ